MRGRLLLAAASAALFALLLEGGFRLLEGGAPWQVEVAEKPLGVQRVIVLGGSTAAGSPVPQLGFAAQLEASLRRLAPAREIELVNLAVDGSASGYVRRLAEHVLAHGAPDLLLVLTAHNEFLNRSGLHSRLRHWAYQTHFRFAVTRVLVARRQPAHGPDPLPPRLEPVDRTGPWFRERLARYRDNLEAIAAAARARGVPLLLLTGPSNLADWPPVHRDLAQGDYDAAVARAQRLLAEGRLDEAERAVASWSERFGEDAMFVYLRGRIEQRRGRFARARELFVRARDLDPYPWRALTSQNAAVRSVADGDGVLLVDAERALAERAPHGLVGFDWIADNVHPTPLGNAVIAGEIAQAMARAGLLIERTLAPESPERALERFARLGPPSRRQRLEHARLLLEGVYCMKTPFYYYSAARDYLESARELAPDHWAAWANLGALALLEGRRDEGVELLRRAASLKQRPFAAHDRALAPYLALALERAGVPPDEWRGGVLLP